MVARGDVLSDIQGTGLLTAFPVLVDIVKYEEPFGVIRSGKPGYYICRDGIYFILAERGCYRSAPSRDLAFWDPRRTLDKALFQLLFRSPVEPEDGVECALMSPGEVGSKLCLANAPKAVQSENSSLLYLVRIGKELILNL